MKNNDSFNNKIQTNTTTNSVNKANESKMKEILAKN